MTDDNEAQRRHWNDEQWSATWLKRERLTDHISPYLLEAVSLRDGERVLDVGCGGGRTTIAAARAVGAGGSAVGADLSEPLTQVAQERASRKGVLNATFVVADMQSATVGGDPFDVAMSQFGVMFFDEPVRAFANIGRQLRPSGRCVFACWRTPGENLWWIENAIATLVPPAPAPPAGKSPTGPFALAEPGRTAEILGTAGFDDVRRTAHDLVVELPREILVDEGRLRSMGITDDTMPEARIAVADRLAPFAVDGDNVRITLAFQIFEATASGS